MKKISSAKSIVAVAIAFALVIAAGLVGFIPYAAVKGAEAKAEKAAAAAAAEYAASLKEIDPSQYVEGVSEASFDPDGNLVVTSTATGIEGDVVLKITLDNTGAVSAIEVIEQNETPALGGVALSDEYLPKLNGITTTDGVDAFAGATITSNAIFQNLENAFAQFAASK